MRLLAGAPTNQRPTYPTHKTAQLFWKDLVRAQNFVLNSPLFSLLMFGWSISHETRPYLSHVFES